MHTPYVGEVRVFPGEAVPDGWLACDGQALSSTEYPELFAALGDRYGRQGNEFCLPDLRGRAVMGAGQGNGLSLRTLGEATGLPAVALDVRHLPRHKHHVYGRVTDVTSTGTARKPLSVPQQPGEHWLVQDSSKRDVTGGLGALAKSAASMPESSETTGAAGGTADGSAQPHENRQPYLGLRFCIAWRGQPA